MNYKVYLTETFQKSMKILKKKYRRVKDDISKKEIEEILKKLNQEYLQ